MKVFVLNGWVASSHAWDRCMFPRDRIFDYIECLDGKAREAFEAEKESVLVGWSMGGSVALSLAAASPRKVAGLVLVSASARMMKAPNWDGMSPLRLKALEYGFLRNSRQAIFPQSANLPEVYVEDDVRRMKRGLEYLEKTDLRMDLVDLLSKGGLQCPVNIFQSERDGIVKPGNAAFLKAVFPHAQLDMIPGQEHALPATIPEKIDAAVALCMMRDSRSWPKEGDGT